MLEILREFLTYLHDAEILGDMMIYLNVILGVLLFLYEIKEYRSIRNKLYWAWIKLAYAMLGFGWAVTYTILAIVPSDMVYLLGSTIVRAGITATLGIMTAGAFARRYRS